MSALLPCPFCGGPAKLSLMTGGEPYDGGGAYCPNDACGQSIPMPPELWNLRAPSAPLEGETPETGKIIAWWNGMRGERSKVQNERDSWHVLPVFGTQEEGDEDAGVARDLLEAAVEALEEYAGLEYGDAGDPVGVDLEPFSKFLESGERRLRALSPASTEKPVALPEGCPTVAAFSPVDRGDGHVGLHVSAYCDLHGGHCVPVEIRPVGRAAPASVRECMSSGDPINGAGPCGKCAACASVRERP